MARQGRAGPALSIAAIGSFFAGTVATLGIAIFAPMVAKIAISFSAPEYFSLMVLGLVASVALASGAILKALAAVVLGLLLGTIGRDIYSGLPRLTFGLINLSDGLDFIVVAMGMFGLAEVIRTLERPIQTAIVAKGPRGLLPSREDFRRSTGPIVRGTLIGSILGVLPGGGAMLSSFASYTVEKRISRRPEAFGKGAIEGVAGPESANNAGAQTSFIPMLTLGIPSNPVMALMIGAMIVQGINPGPNVVVQRPDLFWGIIASMWVGNLMLIILNLPLVRLWVSLISIPYRFIFPAIITFCAIGAYSLHNSGFDLYVLALFGLVGYVFMKLEIEAAPFLLAFIISPIMEENFRRSMLLARGDPTVFVTQPISLGLLLAALALLLAVFLPSFRATRAIATSE